ncbi:hypothetical protein [Cellulomonas phragmiteti]|uniref:Lipoprotein n=1 Tax=Cellulomonas phragmiteti TaxID=478780 RepID=A0ABQ4DIM1_9CELL|nr:hypothetical protein [Cellulomonas phragmiteti]GIG39189.1 hypothetical protein Cph01nite_09510 [Cellulomonas phragmiteti]
MHRSAMTPLAILVLLGASSLLTACTDEPADGTGYLQVSDLEDPPLVGHFTAEPVTVLARVDVTATGCVTVEIDGVERLPVWPTGTTVEQDATDLDAYVVTLPGGVVLTTGDSFEGPGVVDDGPGTLTAGSEPDGKVATLVAFCALDAPPVAFFDAAAIRPVVD